MNTTEYLLATAAEECAELAQRISKALRFGLDDRHPKNDNVPCAELIAREYEDLLGAMYLDYARAVQTVSGDMDCGGNDAAFPSPPINTDPINTGLQPGVVRTPNPETVSTVSHPLFD